MPNRVDNFNRADSAVSPGTPSDGLGGYSGASFGTWGISGNAAYCATSTFHGVLFMETSLADVTVQATLTVAGSDSGICGRVVDTSNYIVAAANSTTGIKLFKRVSGTFTQLGSTYVTPLANNDVLALRMDGSDLTVFVNGVSIITATDAAFSTATMHGLRANNDTAVRFEDLSITLFGGASATGTITLDAFTLSGDMATGALSQLSSGFTLDAFALAGFLGLAPGRIDSNPFKNWTGTLLTGTTIPRLTFLRLSDMTTVLQLTNQTTAGDGVLTVTNAAFTPGTTYLVVAASVDGASLGAEIYTAT